MPYRVGCMSLTSALAFGFDERFCSRQCGRTAASPYFNAAGSYHDDGARLRPAMMLAGHDEAAVRSLIDRGVAADSSFPAATPVDEHQRSGTQCPRGPFRADGQGTGGRIPDRGAGRRHNRGAGGCAVFLHGSRQRSGHRDAALRAGRPCRPSDLVRRAADGLQPDECAALAGGGGDSELWYGHRAPQPSSEIPLPAVAMFFYAGGATAIEAYWKSVAWPEKASSSASRCRVRSDGRRASDHRESGNCACTPFGRAASIWSMRARRWARSGRYRRPDRSCAA